MLDVPAAASLNTLHPGMSVRRTRIYVAWRRVAGLAVMVTLVSWEFLICGFVIGYLPRSWFAIFGPISWPIFVFAVPIVSAYTLAMIVGSQATEGRHMSTIGWTDFCAASARSLRKTLDELRKFSLQYVKSRQVLIARQISILWRSFWRHHSRWLRFIAVMGSWVLLAFLPLFALLLLAFRD